MPVVQTIDTTTLLNRVYFLADGDIVKTLGYHRPMDGGGNEFVYRAAGRPDPSISDEGFFVRGGKRDDYFEAIDKTVANVKQFGTRDNPNFSDDIALQNAVKSWKRYSGRLHFPRGKYHITRTLNLGGSRVIGNLVTADGVNSASFNILDDRFSNRPRTSVGHGGASIVWVGADPAPMITYDSFSLIWDGPALWGKYSNATNPPATVGFEVTKNPGLGSGGIHFKQLHVAAVGIALHANGQTNVDQFHVDRFQIRNVDIGFRAESSQNTANYFGYVTAHTIKKSVFDYQILAHTVVSNFTANNGIHAFVTCDKSSSASGQFVCNSMKIDPHASGMILIDTSAHYQTHARFVLHSVTGAGRVPMKIKGEAIVMIRDSQNIVTNGQLTLEAVGDHKLVVEFQNCYIHSNITTQTAIASATANTYVVFRDCFGLDGQPRPSEMSVANGIPVLI